MEMQTMLFDTVYRITAENQIRKYSRKYGL